MAVMSMTGFARVDGSDEGANWYWELRSVNGRGLDVRVRVPSGCDGLELPARELVGKRLTRGNVTVQLTQRRTASGLSLAVNNAALAQVLELAKDLQKRLNAPAPTVEGLLGLRGVLETVEAEEAEAVVAQRSAVQLVDLGVALDQLIAARAGEGGRLADIIGSYLDRIAELVEAVAASPARRVDAIAARFSEVIERLVQEKAAQFDEARLHQEAVLLATKADIEEELQRLRAHVAAARELLSGRDAMGRRLDFLTQEFNREANTLCSKSNDSGVTKLGLELKACDRANARAGSEH